MLGPMPFRDRSRKAGFARLREIAEPAAERQFFGEGSQAATWDFWRENDTILRMDVEEYREEEAQAPSVICGFASA